MSSSEPNEAFASDRYTVTDLPSHFR